MKERDCINCRHLNNVKACKVCVDTHCIFEPGPNSVNQKPGYSRVSYRSFKDFDPSIKYEPDEDLNEINKALKGYAIADIKAVNDKYKERLNFLYGRGKANIAGPFAIEKVIFNNPATIVLWKDGTKTVVKCQEGDIFDPEKGLTMAIAKKVYGNKGSYCDVIKKWTKKYEEEQKEKGEVVMSIAGDEIAKAFKRLRMRSAGCGNK